MVDFENLNLDELDIDDDELSFVRIKQNSNGRLVVDVKTEDELLTDMESAFTKIFKK